MINIYNFVKGLKVSWIRRLINNMNDNTQWSELFNGFYGKSDKLTTLGGEWGEWFFKKRQITNKFWLEVFDSWKQLCRVQEPKSNIEINSSCLWYNYQFSDNPLYFDKWSRQGIRQVGDILDASGAVMTLEMLGLKYNLNINFLEYHRIKILAKTFVSKYKKSDSFLFPQPSLPLHLNILKRSEKGCKDFYLALMNKEQCTPNCVVKWHSLIQNPDDDWRKVFAACFKSIQENKYSWFQYRIIFSILGTKEYLFKVKLTDCDKCYFCKTESESISHIFCKCPHVQQLWHNLKEWISNILDIHIDFNKTAMILGYTESNDNFWPVNFLLIITHYYIFSCSRKKIQLNIFDLQKEIKCKFVEQSHLAKINFSTEKFNKIWHTWKNLFVGI